ncbi:hypothetical protein PYW07_011118 [Mythimna separata]|uniref:Carboxylic ester hydrolase n=1 Tax=Mythimna separata TaxID=271217 RepID=A0AAD7Y7A0_MYTSE|nr:hypothetical protein PYW07_011118 [Mythimna separata]
MLSVIILISVNGIIVQGLSRIDPLVSTKGGLIRGLLSEDGYAQFLGVPYAVVDENNPFGPSKPHPGFKGIFEAYESNECPQIKNDVTSGTLDCLTINIYVPSIADSQHRLPVMVWIHGVGFTKGSADSDGLSPKFLLKHDVIVVAINYRLGAYGFMCLDIPEVPGNQGLKDQVLALRWINENIEAFGGNSKEITVFGESAGAISVNLHLFSLYEKLFQRAIIQSGPALTHIWKRTSDNSAPIKLASELGLNTTNIYEALDYVASIDALKIIKICDDLDNTFAFMGNAMVTIPCLEKEFEGVDNFITDHPRNVVSSKAKTTSVIIGYNSDEAAVMLATATDEYYRQVFSFGSNLEIGFDLHDDLKDAADTVRHFYIGDAEITKNVEEAILDFSTDFTYAYPTQLTADLLLANGASDVYRYIFSYNGGRNLLSIQMNLNITGATHADELGYLFDYDMFDGEIDPEDQLVIDRMTAIWTNFAKFGNPTPEITELLPVKWDPITTTTHPYLDINLDLTPGSRPSHDRMAFWDLFYRLYGKYQI